MLSVRRDSEGVTVSFSCSVVTTVTVTGPVSCDSLTWRGAALLLWTSACSSVWTYTWKHMNSSCNTGREHSSLRHSESLRTFLQSLWATRASLSMFTLCLTVCLTKLCKLLLKSLQLNFVSSPQAALFDHLITFYWWYFFTFPSAGSELVTEYVSINVSVLLAQWTPPLCLTYRYLLQSHSRGRAFFRWPLTSRRFFIFVCSVSIWRREERFSQQITTTEI